MTGFDDPAFYGDRWAAVYDDHHGQMDPGSVHRRCQASMYIHPAHCGRARCWGAMRCRSRERILMGRGGAPAPRVQHLYGGAGLWHRPAFRVPSGLTQQVKKGRAVRPRRGWPRPSPDPRRRPRPRRRGLSSLATARTRPRAPMSAEQSRGKLAPQWLSWRGHGSPAPLAARILLCPPRAKVYILCEYL